MTTLKKHCKILIVEDDLKLQKVLNDKIAREGCQPVTAIDGEEGLRRIDQDKPDVVLLDLRMPRMSGLEMLETVRKKYDNSELPVVVLTNYGDEENISRALDLKSEAFMVKSNFSLEEIMSKVLEIIKKYAGK